MTDFNEILQANEENLLQVFYKFKEETLTGNRIESVAASLKLRPQQLICAVGFNWSSKYLTEILPTLGYATFEELSQERNEIFTTDIYKKLSLDNVLSIYTTVKTDAKILEVLQYLLKQRLEKIESRIEATVNSLIIDKYKAEIRSIYNDRIASIDFVEERLNRPNDGFRALLNEVSIIIDSKMIPAGDIFFRNTILPQEKRKILNKGVIPEELVKARLEDEETPPAEKQVLHEYLKQHRGT